MVNWRGDQVQNKVLLAAGRAVNSILADCVKEAKGVHPPQVRTGTFQGSIQMREAKVFGLTTVVGFWGSFSVNYAIFLEKGTCYIEEYMPLRRSADRYYPELPDRMRRELA